MSLSVIAECSEDNNRDLWAQNLSWCLYVLVVTPGGIAVHYHGVR